MAFVYDNNFTPATGAEYMYRLKNLVVGTGTWIVKGSSDGTSFNNNGSNDATAGTDYYINATVAAVNRSWFRIRRPGSSPQPEWLIQHNTSGDVQWRIKYSPSAGFIGGSASATQVPSATDEIVLLGAGTDASPTFATLLPTNNTYRANLICQNAAPYGWIGWAFPTGGGNPTHGIMHDSVAGDAADTSPFVVYVSGTSNAWRGDISGLDFSTEDGASSPKAHLSNTLTPSNFKTCLPAGLGTSQAASGTIPTRGGTNPYSAKDEIVKINYWRSSSLTSPVGRKGESAFLRWNATVKATGDTFTDLATNDRCVFGHVNGPWDGSTPTV